MKPQLLQIAPMMTHVEEALENAYQVHRLWQQDDQAAFLGRVGADIRGIATSGHHGAPADLLDALPNVEIIASYGVGYDAIDTADCKARNIRVTNTPDVLNDAMAELTVGMMIGLCRRIPQADAYVRAGRWTGGNFPLTGELTGAHVGILGLGRIGKEIALRLQAFRMRVSYHGRTRQAYQPYTYYPDLVEMARDVDWLVAIAPGSPQTNGIVSREVMQALGPKGSLVNMGRGSLVDEAALIELLQSGELGAAALDVFEDEPNVPEALYALDNVVLSPHQGSATEKTRTGMGDLVIRNLAAHFAGNPLITPVV